MNPASCTRCQQAVEPYSKGPRPQHPEWCRQCRQRASRRTSQARYQQTEKGRATAARHMTTEKFHAAVKRYQQTEKFRALQARWRSSERRREYQRRYQRTEKYLAMAARSRQRYQQTEEFHAAVRRHQDSEKFRVTRARYKQSEEGRAMYARAKALRRARELNATVLEVVDRRTIFALDDGLCHLCDLAVDPETFHVDHVIPLAVEPIHAAFNCAVAHPACNVRKWKRLTVLSATARARWQERRPEHLALLQEHLTRLVA